MYGTRPDLATFIRRYMRSCEVFGIRDEEPQVHFGTIHRGWAGCFCDGPASLSIPEGFEEKEEWGDGFRAVWINPAERAIITHCEASYRALDERIAKTKAKQAALLMVLEHPEIPLHNNPA